MLVPDGQPKAHLDWIDGRTGGRTDLLAGRFEVAVAGAWRGLRVARGRLAPGEAVDGYLLGHVLSFDVGGGGWREYDWPGIGRSRGETPPLAVNILPAGTRYSAAWRPGPETVVVEIAPTFAAEVAARLGSTGALRPAAAVEDPFVVHLALALVEEARAGAPGGALAAESLGVSLVAHLLRRSEGPHPCPARRPTRVSPAVDARLRRVLDHIGGHLHLGLSLGDLAREAGMDVYRFAREFKLAIGVSPHRYVTLERIQRAKALLRDRALSVSEVALRTGFATPSHFAATFRRMTGQTPREHREAGGRPGAGG